MTGQALFDKDKLTKVEATIKVESLQTGMEMRDHHMREKVFKTADGALPPLHFVSTSIACDTPASCSVKGPLSIRGTPQDAVFVCTMTNGNASADCQATIKLSAYGIERPTQLGVTVADEVPVHLVVGRK